MVTAGRSQLRLALLTLPLLLHAAAAAHLTAPSSAEQLGEFSVLEAIKSQVDLMNDNLEDLETAIDGITTTVGPTTLPPTGSTEPTTAPTTKEPATTTAAPTTKEPATTTAAPTTTEPTTTAAPTTTEPTTTTAPTTTEPTTTTAASTTTEPTTTAATPTPVEGKQQRLFISRSLLSLTLDDIPCSDLKEDIHSLLNDSQKTLDLVAEEQLSNVTLGYLQGNNTYLNYTTSCVSRGEIKFDDEEKADVKSDITETKKSGEDASNVIDDIVNPPTPPAPTTQPPPEDDDSGFRAATIALGVLFSLSLIAVAGLAFYVHRLK